MHAAASLEGPWTRRRRCVLALLVLAVVSTAPGCGGVRGDGSTPCSDHPTKVAKERQVDVSYDGPVSDSSELRTDPSPRLVVQVTNAQPQVERVRLMFDGAAALDVDLPAGMGCSPGDPVFTVAYDVRPGPVEVQLDLQGATSTTTIEVPESGTAWAVVQVQSEREWGDITLSDTKPSWG